MSEPQYFGVIDHVELPELEFPGFKYLANFHGGLHAVCFTVRNLENPTTIPIGLFYHNGSRRYVWRDRFWADVDLPCNPLVEAVTIKLKNIKDADRAMGLQRVLDILKVYKIDHGPTDEDHIDNPASRNRQFYRVLYEVRD